METEEINRIARVLKQEHWTLMKFSTNYRFVFGGQAEVLEPCITKGGYVGFEELPEGKTIEEAFFKAISIFLKVREVEKNG